MDFNTILNNRVTNFTWSDEKVDNDEIKDIVNSVLSKVPSKQKRMPYSITVLDYSDAELRKDIFFHTHRDEEKTVEDDDGNPQTLAPILLAFSKRNPDYSKLAWETTDNDVTGFTDERIIYMEMGIASMYLMTAFENAGLSTGFCQCIVDKPGLGRKLGLNYPVDLLMGVGYKSDSNEFLDPRTDTVKPVYYETHHVRPSLEEVVTFKF